MSAGRSGGSPGRDVTADLARGLGVFSLALGSAQLAAPGAVARLAGVQGDGPAVRTVTSLVGTRELAQGAGILSGRGTAGWVWSRVAGDVVDIATLAVGASRKGAAPMRLGLGLAALAGVTVADVVTARGLSRGAATGRGSAGPSPPSRSTGPGRRRTATGATSDTSPSSWRTSAR
jgi:hypothetical protein